MCGMYQPRFYRNRVAAKGLVSFGVIVDETDLQISASRSLVREARESVVRHRRGLEDFIAGHPPFATSFVPVDVPESAPPVVREMAEAARIAGVGPMAAVAGTIAEFVGRDLLARSEEVIVENGGDIFMKTLRERRMGIYAGDSPLSEKVALVIRPDTEPIGVCTSSGTVGHSTSLGSADAVVVVSARTALADAAATAIGNRVHAPRDIDPALAFAKTIPGLAGVVLVVRDKLGAWGEIELAELSGRGTTPRAGTSTGAGTGPRPRTSPRME